MIVTQYKVPYMPFVSLFSPLSEKFLPIGSVGEQVSTQWPVWSEFIAKKFLFAVSPILLTEYGVKI